MSRQKCLITAAKALSVIFTPFYLPTVGLMALFMFSYLSLLPWLFKIQVLTLVYIFTVLMPILAIRLYRRLHGWTLVELGHRERRAVPYVISIGCYLLCVYVMETLHIPHFMGSIVVATLVIQTVCAIVNSWWKISTHTAAAGGMAGGLFAFGEIFGFNPVWWLCATFAVAGLVGTSRMVLRQHTLSQVVGGFIAGAVCAAATILLV